MFQNRINQADFARKIKVKPQAITNAIKRGLLIKHGTGRAAYIDLKCPMTIAYLKNASTNRHRGKSTKPPSKPKPVAPKKKDIEYVPPSPEAVASEEAFMDKQEIERLVKIETIEEKRIKNKKSRGVLIERDTVQLFIDNMHVIDNGQWKTLGLRVSSDIAALLGLDDDEKIRDIAEAIDKAAFNTLKQVKREQNKFLKKIGAKKLASDKAA